MPDSEEKPLNTNAASDRASRRDALEKGLLSRQKESAKEGFLTRLGEVLLKHAEPGELVTAFAVLFRAISMMGQIGQPVVPFYREMFSRVSPSEWAGVSFAIFACHVIAMWQKRRTLRIAIEITASVFLLAYALYYNLHIHTTSGGLDTCLYFVVSLFTIELLIRKRRSE